MSDPHFDPNTDWCQCQCPVCSPVGCSRQATAGECGGVGCDNYKADGSPKRVVYEIRDMRRNR